MPLDDWTVIKRIKHVQLQTRADDHNAAAHHDYSAVINTATARQVFKYFEITSQFPSI